LPASRSWFPRTTRHSPIRFSRVLRLPVNWPRCPACRSRSYASLPILCPAPQYSSRTVVDPAGASLPGTQPPCIGNKKPAQARLTRCLAANCDPASRPQLSAAKTCGNVLPRWAARPEIRVEGPEVGIERSCLSSLVLILHAWATNAAKYGVRSPRSGTLCVRWTLGAEGSELVWEEVGVDMLEVAEGSGFGARFASSSVRQLGASISRTAHGGHFCLRLLLPGSVSPR